MKLTKKDKIMLLVLAVVLFVAVFYMFGIKPLGEQKEEFDKTIATKKEEVAALEAKLNEIRAGSVDKKIIEVVDYYYANNKPSELHPVLDKIEIEKMMYDLFNEYNVTGYATAGWNVADHTYTYEYDGVAVTTIYTQANISTFFQIDTKEHFVQLVDKFRDDPHFRVTSFSVQKSQEEKAPDGETPGDPPAEKFEYSGNITLELYMGDKYEAQGMPKPLANVENLALGETAGTITFKAMDNAKTYEVYSFEADETGKRTYTRVDNIAYSKDDATGIVTVTVREPVDGQTLVISAMGDYEEYCRSLLTDDMPYVTMVVAK